MLLSKMVGNHTCAQSDINLRAVGTLNMHELKLI